MKEYTYNWHGTLTVENADQVADLFRRYLSAGEYTFVEAYEFMGWKPNANLHQGLDKVTVGRSGTDHAFITVSDTSGVWQMSTTLHDGEINRGHAAPEIVFEWRKATIKFRTPAGKMAWWLVAPETEL